MHTKRHGFRGTRTGRRAFATLAVLVLGFILLILVIGLSRFLSGFRADVRLIELKQRARVGSVETNRPPVLPAGME